MSPRSKPRRTTGVAAGTRALGLASVSVVLALSTTACLASQGDIRVLQDELRALRSSIAQTDTARRAQTDTAMMLITRANDSLRIFSTRFAAFQANVTGGMYDMNRQLLQIQELSGQSQRRLQELRASMETRNEAMVATPSAPTPTDSTKPAGGPGPAQLFQIAFDQMQRGSFGVARSGFQELVDKYPKFEEAPSAQLYIGQSFAEEKNATAADSVYQLVVTKYPQSKAAPTALYKFALSQIAQKKTAPAKVALNRIVKDYPNSDEASLARDLLRTTK
ncbi:MAG TPA: tol-pal system protein YbgF [Gemmatimonadaceae bacterium]|jgi:tol-pal system protein YbgF|nr:tol-pal system protein YbgF [Gemmatimonadaceae bacterium]